MCESGPPLPPIHTMPLWSTMMPWFESGQSGMQRRTAPAVHDVAGLIERDDRRRRIAALADLVRARLVVDGRPLAAAAGAAAAAAAAGAAGGCANSVPIQIRRVVAAVNDPDLILLVDAETDRLPEHPVVRHRSWARTGRPRRSAPARRLRLCRRRLFEDAFGHAQCDQGDDERRANQEIPLHGSILSTSTPLQAVAGAVCAAAPV